MATATFFVLSLMSVFTLQQLILALAGMFHIKKRDEESTTYRRIAVLIFSEGNTSHLRQLLLNFVDQSYPADFFKVYLISSDRSKINLFSDLPIKVVLTYGNNKTSIAKEAIQQIEGVYDIAVCIHQPFIIGDHYLNDINTNFQQGSYFTSPWISREKSHREIVPAPMSGFSALNVSLPLSEYIYTTPYLWLKQQTNEMKETENFHQSLQYRLLQQNIKISLLDNSKAILDEQACAESKSYFDKIQLFILGLTRIFKGNYSMLFNAIWKLQPHRAAMIPGLFILSLFDTKFLICLAAYLFSGVIIIIQSPGFDFQKSASNFVHQFTPDQWKLRRKRSLVQLNTASH
jgi:hypothetical protein